MIKFYGNHESVSHNLVYLMKNYYKVDFELIDDEKETAKALIKYSQPYLPFAIINDKVCGVNAIYDYLMEVGR